MPRHDSGFTYREQDGGEDVLLIPGYSPRYLVRGCLESRRLCGGTTGSRGGDMRCRPVLKASGRSFKEAEEGPFSCPRRPPFKKDASVLLPCSSLKSLLPSERPPEQTFVYIYPSVVSQSIATSSKPSCSSVVRRICIITLSKRIKGKHS